MIPSGVASQARSLAGAILASPARAQSGSDAKLGDVRRSCPPRGRADRLGRLLATFLERYSTRR
jgi:hypothetical protein